MSWTGPPEDYDWERGELDPEGSYSAWLGAQYANLHPLDFLHGFRDAESRDFSLREVEEFWRGYEVVRQERIVNVAETGAYL